MVAEYKPTHDPKLDTFKVQYLVGGAAVMGLLFPPAYTPFEVRQHSEPLVPTPFNHQC